MQQTTPDPSMSESGKDSHAVYKGVPSRNEDREMIRRVGHSGLKETYYSSGILGNQQNRLWVLYQACDMLVRRERCVSLAEEVR